MDTANLSGRFSRTKRVWWMHRPRLPWVWSDLLTFNLSFLSFLSYFPAKGCQHSPLFSLANVNYCKFTFFECTNRANLLVFFGKTKRIWWLSCHSLFWMSSFVGKHDRKLRKDKLKVSRSDHTQGNLGRCIHHTLFVLLERPDKFAVSIWSKKVKSQWWSNKEKESFCRKKWQVRVG